MNVTIIDNYRSVNQFFTGSTLTDYLIKSCVIREKGTTCTVTRTEKGKPLICVDEKESDIHVSVSHSKNTFACIVANFNIGLDIQHERDIDEMKLSQRYYTDEEMELVRGDSTQFFRLWARKEAYSKYTGEGLAEVMGRLDVLHRDDVIFRDMVIKCSGNENCHVAVCAGKGENLNEIQISCREQDG